MRRRPPLRNVSDGPSITRRTLLAAGAGAATVSLAGCSAVVDFLAGFALEDVNVFNATDARRAGSIEVVDPTDEMVLDDEFDVPGQEDSGDGEGDGSITFDDVLTDAGEYAVTVALDDPLPLDDGGAGTEGNETDGNESPVENETDGGSTDGTRTDEGAGNESDPDEGEPGGPVVERTVEVSDPDAEHVVVLVGERDGDDPVTVAVIEDFSELGEYLEE